MKKLSTEEFIKKSIEKHGDKYDYSLSVYNGRLKKVKIICPIHGEFEQVAANHMSGNGCPICAGRGLNKESFIDKVKEIHNDKYDYSKVNYINLQNKIEIICPIHGSFWQKAANHMRGDGCPKCANNVKLTQEEFIEKANSIHHNKYDYSKTVYKGHAYDIIITCPVHGDFIQKANKHLAGNGCPQCAEENKGWDYTSWEKAGKSSSNFDGFKLYVLECWDDCERFYKIGKTFNNLGRRYKTKKKMPYEWRVVYIEEGSARYISEKERDLKRLFFNNKYMPKKKFKGKYECFNAIDLNKNFTQITHM